ncbi:unnamed protein product [Vicia faba]|uniref:Uncharacterized protein n=1 Tax=Vicia faba TaxID=3906 RepID=A0AAV0ZJ59_VICFA|nr:unnamed protein product [Vicia faba]
MFSYLEDLITKARYGNPRIRAQIPMGRLITNILIESLLVEALNLAQKMEVMIGRPLDGKDLLDMEIISEDTILPKDLDEESISNRRIVASDKRKWMFFKKMVKDYFSGHAKKKWKHKSNSKDSNTGTEFLNYMKPTNPLINLDHLELVLDSKIEITAVPDRDPNLYSTPSNPLLLRTNILPPPSHELLLNFEYEIVDHLRSLMDTYFDGMSPKETSRIWNEYTNWVITNTSEA